MGVSIWEGTKAKTLVELLNEIGGNLSMITAEDRDSVYASMSQIASIVRQSDVETIKKLFPAGDMLVIPWKDMDDAEHNTDQTAYQVPWHILGARMFTLQTGEVVPGLAIQMHKCSAYGVQFSNFQAFMKCPEGLAAGTYYVTFGGSWGSKGANSGTTWQFTLTQAVPAGGRLSGFEQLPDVAVSTFKVKSWASASAAEPIETVNVTAGSEGTSLGTMNLTTKSNDNLNCMQRVGYGSNRWKTSAIRQYLNKSGQNWFASQEDFDIRPNQYDKRGFMTGFDEEFLSAIKPVKVTTALNTVEGYTNTTEDTYDTFFLPSLEEMNVTPQLAGVEGDAFEYWKQALGSASKVGTGVVFDAFKIPAINAKSAQSVRLRSASRGYANFTWIVSSSGYVYDVYYGGHAYAAYRFSPVCVIC